MLSGPPYHLNPLTTTNNECPLPVYEDYCKVKRQTVHTRRALDVSAARHGKSKLRKKRTSVAPDDGEGFNRCFCSSCQVRAPCTQPSYVTADCGVVGQTPPTEKTSLDG